MKEIDKIIKAYDTTNWEKEQTALATVVVVEESAYRRIGARMYVSSNGQWIGGISGGCLEGDALKRAKIAILNKQPSIVVYDTMEEDAHQIGVGLGCNGRIEVLFVPIDPKDGNNPIELLKRLKNTRTVTLLLQVIETANTENLGMTKEYINRSDFAKKLEIDLPTLQGAGETALTKGKSTTLILKQKNGPVKILLEVLRPNVRLILVGDNYDVNAFVGIADELGWEIHVAGKTRKLERYIYEKAKKVYSYEAIRAITVDDYTAIILMSHDYLTDLKLLKRYATLKIPYIGMLGPKKRLHKMQEAMEEEGMDIQLEKLVNLYAPVGLDIGAESPEEIALSIAAEIITVFRKRAGGHLKERKGPIHDRS